MTDTATVVPTSTALELLGKGGKLPEILTALVPKVAVTEVVERRLDLPKTVEVTRKITDAVNTLGLMTVGHKALTLDERRVMAQTELDALSAERDAIDVVIKYLETRKGAMKPMVYNHFDSEIDATLETLGDDGVVPPVDDDGHYLTKVSVFAQGGARHFDRQLAEGGPSVTAERLKEAVGAVEGFEHEDYLACTTAVRVLDEERTLIHMRSHPAVVQALAVAIKPGKTTSSFYHRPS